MLVRLVSSPTLRSDKQGRHSRMCELVDMYTKHCRSILEYAVPVWNGAITGYECKDIERVQKMALHITRLSCFNVTTNCFIIRYLSYFS